MNAAQIDLTESGRISVSFLYQYALTERIKALPGRAYDAILRAWTLPNSEEARDLAEVLCREHGFTATLRAKDALGMAVKAREGLSEAVSSLMPFQREGVSYLLNAKRSFLADEMGLGKTPQALCTLEEDKAYPALIVCPSGLKSNWQAEASVWLPGRRAVVIDSGKFNLRAHGNYADVFIISFEILAKSERREEGRKKVTVYPFAEALAACGLKAVVVDESQHIKSHETKRHAACCVAGRGARLKLCLTGTPVWNRPIDLAGQLLFLERLRDFGGYWSYAKRYCNAKKGPFGWNLTGASNLEELNEKLRASCYIRRRKCDVLTELPPKCARTVYLELDNLKEYRDIENETADFLQDSEGVTAMAKLELLKQAAARGKMHAVKEWIQEFVDRGEKLIVFGWHTSIIRELTEHFQKCSVVIVGSTSDSKREEAVRSFQDDPACLLFFGNLQAAGVGLTLTAASNVAFIEFGWTPAEHEQAEDRPHRIGQTLPVTCWYLVARGTVDEKIIELLGKKQQATQTAVDGSVEADANKTVLGGLIKGLKSIDRPKAVAKI